METFSESFVSPFAENEGNYLALGQGRFRRKIESVVHMYNVYVCGRPLCVCVIELEKDGERERKCARERASEGERRRERRILESASAAMCTRLTGRFPELFNNLALSSSQWEYAPLISILSGGTCLISSRTID